MEEEKLFDMPKDFVLVSHESSPAPWDYGRWESDENIQNQQPDQICDDEQDFTSA